MIYLRSTPEDVFRRVRHDGNRPLLQVADPLGRLRNLYAERDPLYRETAHFVIETGRPSVAKLVNMILMQLELAGVLSPPASRLRGLSGAPMAAPKLAAMRIDRPPLQRVDIELGDRSYQINIGSGLLDDPARPGVSPMAATALIVTNTTVGSPVRRAAGTRPCGTTPDRFTSSSCPTAKRTRTGRRST